MNYALGAVKKSKVFNVMIESPDCLLKILKPIPVPAQYYTVFKPALTFDF